MDTTLLLALAGALRLLLKETENAPPALTVHGLAPSSRARRRTPAVAVDVTDLYLGDHPAFSLPRGQRGDLGVQGQERERSWLEWARAFPENVLSRPGELPAAGGW